MKYSQAVNSTLSNMARTAEIVNGSIVLMGSFAPGGMSADWLHKNKLIGDVDLEQARAHPETVVSSRLTKIENETIIIQITNQRIHIISKDVLRPVIKDLALGMIALMGRVDVRIVGLNFMSHYQMANDEEYHKVGDVLVPKKPWLDLYPDKNWSAGVSDLSIKIIPGERTKQGVDQNGVSIRLQPSAKLDRGIFLTYNNHMELNVGENDFPDELASKFIADNWDLDHVESSRVFRELLDSIVA